MSRNLTIGIDVGTTTGKGGLLDPSAGVLDYFNHPYPTDRSGDGRVEQDGNHWTAGVAGALDRLCDRKQDIAAIGLCSQVNTHLFVGADGEPLAPAIVWQDTRTRAEAAELDAMVSDDQRIAWWGVPRPIDASHALSRMLWMQRHRPEIWQKTAWVMLPKDYCIFRLTGQVATDGLSSVGLVNQDLDYIADLIDLVPGAAERLPPIRGLLDTVGEVTGGPAAGLPVVNGSMDGWTGLLGCGASRNAATCYLSGTSEILGINSHRVHPTPGVIVFPDCEGIRLHAGPTQSGGASKLWYARLSRQTPEQMAARADTSDYARPAPIFVPHLQGERAPIWNPDARGMFLGLDHTTGDGDLARAVYEGVAFSARQLLEALELSSGVHSDVITCGGGGFRSDTWNRIRANVLGRPLQRIAVKDPGVLGAAAMAACAAGLHASLADAFEQLAVIDVVYEPDSAMTRRYDDLFALYKSAIEATEQLNHAFVGLASSDAWTQTRKRGQT